MLRGLLMADMHNLQLLIDANYNCDANTAKQVLTAADEAGTTLPLGLVSIGNLMYFASSNEDYDEESLRADMFNVGLLMRCLGNFQVAIRTAEENAGAVVRSEKEGAAE
ncbi:hypothetical protein GKAS_03717 [Kluyvera ascorbata ATCC 33433]|nr:hypothetical protein GKAS_03717 [Kluyvera ascorbata ATCC 33433]STW99036.1 Uncharacterised protein [Kluyvera ascorbata]